MIEALQYEIEQMKNRLKEQKQQVAQDMEGLKKQVTDAAKGLRAASIVSKKLQQAAEEIDKKEDSKRILQELIFDIQVLLVQNSLKFKIQSKNMRDVWNKWKSAILKPKLK